MKINTVDTVIQDFREGQNIFRRPSVELMVREILRLNNRIAELEQEQRWIPVRDYPSQVGWYRVITNNGTEQIREYVREPDRDIHYWDVKDGEWIMMYTNPPLPQTPQEGE